MLTARYALILDRPLDRVAAFLPIVPPDCFVFAIYTGDPSLIVDLTLYSANSTRFLMIHVGNAYNDMRIFQQSMHKMARSVLSIGIDVHAVCVHDDLAALQ